MWKMVEALGRPSATDTPIEMLIIFTVDSTPVEEILKNVEMKFGISLPDVPLR